MKLESRIIRQAFTLREHAALATLPSSSPTLGERLARLAEKDPKKKDILDLHVSSIERARKFSDAWERTRGETEASEVAGNVYDELGLENSYLTGFARLTVALEFVDHLNPSDASDASASLAHYGIDLEKEQAGIFDPTADMITIEDGIMRKYCEEISKSSPAEEREALAGWINEFFDRYGVYPSYYKGLKKALDTRDTKTRMKDMPRSVKDLFVKNFYDENATIGHIINTVGGWYFMSHYVQLFGEEVRKGVQLGTMGGFLALVFIGSLNLPNRAVDQETEKKANKILTFAPTIGIGLITGMIAPDYPELALLTPALSTILAGGMSYWYQGQMSRRQQITDFQQKGVFARYAALGDFASKVGTPGFHGRVDKFLRTLSSNKGYWKAIQSARRAGETINTDEGEMQDVLANVRDFLRVDTKELAKT